MVPGQSTEIDAQGPGRPVAPLRRARSRRISLGGRQISHSAGEMVLDLWKLRTSTAVNFTHLWDGWLIGHALDLLDPPYFPVPDAMYFRVWDRDLVNQAFTDLDLMSELLNQKHKQPRLCGRRIKLVIS